MRRIETEEKIQQNQEKGILSKEIVLIVSLVLMSELIDVKIDVHIILIVLIFSIADIIRLIIQLGFLILCEPLELYSMGVVKIRLRRKRYQERRRERG